MRVDQLAPNDLVFRPDGGLWPEYQHLASVILGWPETERERRRRELRRFRADCYPNSRPVDLLPLMVSSSAWAAIERDIIQLSEVLAAFFRDIYTGRRILQESWFPAEMLFSNPAYLRSSALGIIPPLFQLGFDLIPLSPLRDQGSPTPVFSLYAIQSHSAAGLGEALQTRISLSKSMPSLYRESIVHRVAGFFRSIRKSLMKGQTAMLVPATSSGAHAEFGFLAAYLSLPLVQSVDLTSRDGRIRMKSVEGQQPLDTIWRQVRDEFLDPLELLGSSLSGVPGMTREQRRGHVAVINPIGAGLLESPQLLPWLGRLCQFYLSEDLRMPVETVLPGSTISENSDIIWNAGKDWELLVDSRPVTIAEFRERLAWEPWRCCARKSGTPSATAPVLTNSGYESVAHEWRVFTSASETGTWSVCPAARVLATYEGQQILKDVWVAASEDSLPLTLLPSQSEPAESAGNGLALSSRVAENLYWIGRYAERAELMCRVLRSVSDRLGESEVNEALPLWNAMRLSIGMPPGTRDPGSGLSDLEAGVRELTFGAIPGSLQYNLQGLNLCVRAVRNRLSDDMAGLVADLWLDEHRDLPGMLLLTLRNLVSLSGLFSESMNRETAYFFLESGRRQERALSVLSLIAGLDLSRDSIRPAILEDLLRVADMRMTYRRRHGSTLRADHVLALILFEGSSPRSVRFQLATLPGLLRQLPEKERTSGSPGQVKELVRHAVDIGADLQRPQVSALVDYNGLTAEGRLWLQQLINDLLGFTQRLSDGWFDYRETYSRLEDYG